MTKNTNNPIAKIASLTRGYIEHSKQPSWEIPECAPGSPQHWFEPERTLTYDYDTASDVQLIEKKCVFCGYVSEYTATHINR